MIGLTIIVLRFMSLEAGAYRILYREVAKAIS